VDFDKLGTVEKLAILTLGAVAVGAHEAQAIVDENGAPATLTECGRVTLLRVLDENGRKGFDTIHAHLVGDEDDDDGEVRVGSGDKLFSLIEHGAEPPELVTHDLDVKRWLAPVLLALSNKISPPGEVAGHA
jgi:hypothetical protein